MIDTPATSKSDRLRSLDVMRGLIVAAMIIVSSPGSWDHVYQPLTHAKWDNTTPTDLIFPFFIFMVGVSIPLANTSLKSMSHIPFAAHAKQIRRALTLFAIGIFLNLYPKFDLTNYGWTGIGYTGVLQRIAEVYLIAVLAYLHVPARGRFLGIAVLLLAYGLLLSCDPARAIPGYNIAHRIDQHVLNLDPGKWVPEGFMSTFPALATGLIGVTCGEILARKPRLEAVAQLLVIGLSLVQAATLWSWQQPFNKNLWSSPFALITCGWASLLLATLTYLIDECRRPRFLLLAEAFGKNAITFYVAFHLVHPLLYDLQMQDGLTISQLYMRAVTGLLGIPEIASLSFALLFTSALWAFASAMAKRKIFLRI